ncbi:MAG: TetR-like C-terminal domain-containing protein [Pseudomonadota bacterium]
MREPAEEAVFPALLIDAIRQGQAEGRIKEGDPYTLAMILWGSLHGCLALPHNFGRQVFENPDEIADTAVDTLMSAVIT